MLFQTFMIFSFALPSLAHDRYHEHRGAEVEDAIKRYSREANVDIGQIKKKLFKRVSAGAHSLETVLESTKFKTNVECAGLCLSIENCHAFYWIAGGEFNLAGDNFCRLLKIDGICLTTDYDPFEIYADANIDITSCAVDCEWSEWQTLTWQNTGTSCSQTCGGGKRTYSRSILSTEEYGGKPCSEDSTKTEDNACNTNPCPVNCEWSEWEASPCNNTCRAGSVRWNRTVVAEAEHGGSCSKYYGGSVEGRNGDIDLGWEKCNMHKCPIICCQSILISATGPSTTANSIQMGKYDFYKKSSNGWPVYERTVGATSQYFYLSNNSYWSIGRDFESTESQTMSGYHQTCLERCPNLCTNNWVYDDQGTWKYDSTIQVSCETCPDVNDLDDWMIWKDNSEIYCGEGACQPCNPEYTLVREGDMSGCSTAEEIKRLVHSSVTGCEGGCDAEKNCTHIWYKWIAVDELKCYLYSSCNNKPDYDQVGGKLMQKPDCGMKGQGWHGPPGNQDLPNQPLQNVASPCDCNERCIGELDCEYWVYQEVDKNCWLKKNFEKIIETEGEISGRKTPTCWDGHQNQEEEDVDCGGSCTACPTCDDNIQNQNEEGVDCGGPCIACPTCLDGIKNQGEADIDCGGPCTDCPTCDDNIKNQEEEDVDCGGPCTACPTCLDNMQNQGEDGIDCGGPCSDCETCDDNIKNQEEEEVDCGGPCPPCPTCLDGIQNQGEETVDCGGPCTVCTCCDSIQNQGEMGVDCEGPCSTSCPALHEDKIPYFEFYGGYNGAGSLMCTVQLNPLNGPFSMVDWRDRETYGCENDMANSMKLCYAKKGTKVRVYAGKPKPGVKGSEIYVDRDMGNRCQTIDRFMVSKLYCEVKVDYIGDKLYNQISTFDVTFEWMERLGKGFCEDGYYKGWTTGNYDGIDSQKSCNDVCLSDDQCKFAAWYPNNTCSRYNVTICVLNNNENHITYKKRSPAISYELKTDGTCTTDGQTKVISGYTKNVDKNDCEIACSTYEWCKGYRINDGNTECRLLTNDQTVDETGWDGLFNSGNWVEPDEWKKSTIYTGHKCYKKTF